jgi:hypothetical protein
MRKLWPALLASGLLSMFACRAAEPSKNATTPEQKGDSKAIQPVSSGYVDVNGINSITRSTAMAPRWRYCMAA